MTTCFPKIKETFAKNWDRHVFIQAGEGKKEKFITYNMFFQDILNYATWLRNKGVKKGDRVLLFIPMSYDLYKILYALFYIGAHAVFIDAWADRLRLTQAVKLAGINVFIGSPKAHLLRLFSKEISNIPHKFMIPGFSGKRTTYHIEQFQTDHINQNDIALITLTTGSTGAPKAAVRTHEFLWHQHNVLSHYQNFDLSEVDFCTFPIFALNNLTNGNTSIIPDFNPAKPTEFNPRTILNHMKKYGATTTVGSPAFYFKLADYLNERNEIFHIDSLLLGGAPVFPKACEKLLKAFPYTEIYIGYGSTEAEPISHIHVEAVADSNIAEGLLVGKPVDKIDLKILTPQDEPVTIENGKSLDDYCVQHGDGGEIIVTADHVNKHYLNDEAVFKTNKIVDEHNIIWHRTGDGGKIDQHGNILLLGRVKNRFKFNGKTYFTLPLEQQVSALDEISLAAVLFHNEEVFVCIEAASKMTTITENIKKKIESIFEKQHITSIRINILKRLPMDPRHNSKVDYDLLRKEL